MHLRLVFILRMSETIAPDAQMPLLRVCGQLFHFSLPSLRNQHDIL